MAVGTSEPGGGKIQFKNPTPDGYAFWTVWVTSGSITVTRTASNEWTIESAGGSQELQCTTSKPGRAVAATDGFYSLTFKLTAVK